MKSAIIDEGKLRKIGCSKSSVPKEETKLKASKNPFIKSSKESVLFLYL